MQKKLEIARKYGKHDFPPSSFVACSILYILMYFDVFRCVKGVKKGVKNFQRSQLWSQIYNLEKDLNYSTKFMTILKYSYNQSPKRIFSHTHKTNSLYMKHMFVL